jgi:sulfite exporter TauE/SafE
MDSIRPFCIGMAHGVAGSAALMLMILATTTDVAAGLLSILVFGLGSISGMMVIGMTITIPVMWSRSISRRLFVGVQSLASLASVSVGVWMLIRLAPSVIGP